MAGSHQDSDAFERKPLRTESQPPTPKPHPPPRRVRRRRGAAVLRLRPGSGERHGALPGTLWAKTETQLPKGARTKRLTFWHLY